MNTILLISQALGLLAFVALIWLIVRAFRKNILWGIAVLLLSPISAVIFGIRYWRDEKQPFLLYLTTFVTSIGLGLLVFTAWGGWDLVQTAYRVHKGIETRTLSDKDASAFMHANLQYIEKANPDDEVQKKLEFIRRYMQQNELGMTGLEKRKLQAEVSILLEDPNLSIAQQDALQKIQKRLTPAPPDNDTAGNIPLPKQTEATVQEPSEAPKTRPQRYRVEYLEIDVSDAGNYVGKTFKVTRKNSDEQECRLIGISPGRLHFEQRGRGGIFTFKYRHRDIEQLKLLAKVTY